ncbi:MAG: 3-hydroxyacyl-CoA dehydrogenase NAD-binding domain-containing protein [Acidimicrobiales bacterium]
MANVGAQSSADVLSGSDVLRRREHVTVIGAGTIGASWAALFLAHGLEVRISDPAPDVEDRVHNMVDQAAPVLGALGLPVDDLTARLTFFPDLEEALNGADVVQENGPESVKFKRDLWVKVERLVEPHTLLLSSTSGIKASGMVKEMTDRTRVLVGHPFNPPHLVPLVEVVPGPETDPAVVAEAAAFYAALGKRPLVLRKEMPGFVANRLQSALFQECVHLVAEGVVDMADLDDIVTSSIGLRWAAAGPFLTFHLGGGTGGLPHFLDHLGPGMDLMWGVLGHPHFDEATVTLLKEQVRAAYGDHTLEELEQRRDGMQIAIMHALAAPPAD